MCLILELELTPFGLASFQQKNILTHCNDGWARFEGGHLNYGQLFDDDDRLLYSLQTTESMTPHQFFASGFYIAVLPQAVLLI